MEEFEQAGRRLLRLGGAEREHGGRDRGQHLAHIGEQISPDDDDHGGCGGVAGKIDQIVAALQKANLADKPRPAKTAISRALSDAGLTPVPETDIDALVKAVHDRALKINRSKHEAKKEAQESAQVLTLRQRIQQLEAQLAAGVEVAGLQTGRVQNYALGIAIGLIVMAGSFLVIAGR